VVNGLIKKERGVWGFKKNQDSVRHQKKFNSPLPEFSDPKRKREQMIRAMIRTFTTPDECHCGFCSASEGNDGRNGRKCPIREVLKNHWFSCLQCNVAKVSSGISTFFVGEPKWSPTTLLSLHGPQSSNVQRGKEECDA